MQTLWTAIEFPIHLLIHLVHVVGWGRYCIKIWI